MYGQTELLNLICYLLEASGIEGLALSLAVTVVWEHWCPAAERQN